MVLINSSESRDGSVGIVIRLRAGRFGVRIPILATDFYVLQNVQNGSGAHLLFNAYWGVKRLECEVNHSPPSITKVKNEWLYTSSPPYDFMAWTRKILPLSL
jgi:hypothetical protein